MTSLDNIHYGSRNAGYRGELGNNLIKAQETEFSIFKAIHKNELRKALPDYERIFVSIGSIFTKQVTEKQLFEMQGEQLIILEKLEGITDRHERKIVSPVAKNEVRRLAYTVVDSLVRNPSAKVQAFDPIGLEMECRNVREGHYFQLGDKEKDISKSVLQESKRQAEIELRNEKILGGVIAMSIVGIMDTCLKRVLGSGKTL